MVMLTRAGTRGGRGPSGAGLGLFRALGGRCRGLRRSRAGRRSSSPSGRRVSGRRPRRGRGRGRGRRGRAAGRPRRVPRGACRVASGTVTSASGGDGASGAPGSSGSSGPPSPGTRAAVAVTVAVAWGVGGRLRGGGAGERDPVPGADPVEQVGVGQRLQAAGALAGERPRCLVLARAGDHVRVPGKGLGGGQVAARQGDRAGVFPEHRDPRVFLGRRPPPLGDIGGTARAARQASRSTWG